MARLKVRSSVHLLHGLWSHPSIQLSYPLLVPSRADKRTSTVTTHVTWIYVADFIIVVESGRFEYTIFSSLKSRKTVHLLY